MKYSISKGFSINSSKTNNLYKSIYINSGNIIVNDSTVMIIQGSSVKILPGINKIYFDISNQKLVSSLDDLSGDFIKIYEVEIGDDYSLLGSLLNKSTLSKAPSPISYSDAVDSTLNIKLNKLIKEMEIIKQNNIKNIIETSEKVVKKYINENLQDYVTETLQEEVVVNINTIEVKNEISSIVSIYVENGGYVDLIQSINNIVDKKVILSDNSLDGRKIIISYNKILIKQGE